MKSKSQFWTAVYYTHSRGCYSVQFGQRDGPQLDSDLAHRLAEKYLEDHPKKVRSISFIVSGSARRNGAWERFA